MYDLPQYSGKNKQITLWRHQSLWYVHKGESEIVYLKSIIVVHLRNNRKKDV